MKNKEDLFLNTIQFPRKVSDKIEETATSGPWWYFPDCAHPIGHELQTDRNPYFSCSLIKDRVIKSNIARNLQLVAFKTHYFLILMSSSESV